MILVYAPVFVLIGIPAIVYVSDRSSRRRTRAELDDEAVRSAR
jgi:hypothetical protein